MQLRGVRPFLSDKYDITKHPNYKYLSDFDKRNAFDVERYMSTRPAIVKPDEAFDIYEIDLSTRTQPPRNNGGHFHFQQLFLSRTAAESEVYMEFFNSAVGVLQTLVIALGAGLGIWGAINLMEGYGNDNPGANAHVS